MGIDLFAKEYSSLATTAAAQYKTTNLLAHSLADSNVYVSQVIVNGFVDGRPEAKDKTYTVHPETVAEQFWYLYQHKQETVSLCGEAIQAAQTISNEIKSVINYAFLNFFNFMFVYY